MMQFRPILITPPTESPVSLEELKEHATVDADFTGDDVLLTGLRNAAVAYLDGFRGILGRAMVSQTWQISQLTWLRAFVLPVPDVTEVTISYVDVQGATQTVASEDVSTLDVTTGTLVTFSDGFAFPTLESGNRAPVTVQFTCGFGDADAVPENLKLAVEALATDWYHNRDARAKDGIPLGVQALIAPYRWGAI